MSIEQDSYRVGVVGGGPAGSFLASMVRNNLPEWGVTVFEPRSTSRAIVGFQLSCTTCAGWVQQAPISILERNGIHLPEEVIQGELKEVKVYLPGEEEPISLGINGLAVYRGWTPGKVGGVSSFDAQLLREAIARGAEHVEQLVTGIDLTQRKAIITTSDGENYPFDVVVGAFGHNSRLMNRIEVPEGVTRLSEPSSRLSLVRENFSGINLSDESELKNTVHVIGIPTERILSAAIVPKPDANCLTVVLMGRVDLNPGDWQEFLANSQVEAILSNFNISLDKIDRGIACKCGSQITVRSPGSFMIQGPDGGIRMVMIGDAGPTRPYKNGILGAIDPGEKMVRLWKKFGNGRRAYHIFKAYMQINYGLDNFFANWTMMMLDQIMDHRHLEGVVVTLARGRIPVLSSMVGSTMYHAVTGDYPYWQMPLRSAADVVMRNDRRRQIVE